MLRYALSLMEKQLPYRLLATSLSQCRMVHSYFVSNLTLKISAGHKPWNSGLFVAFKPKSYLSFMIKLSGFPGLSSSFESSILVSKVLKNEKSLLFIINAYRDMITWAGLRRKMIERFEADYIRRKYRPNSANRLLYNIFKVSSVFCSSCAFFWYWDQ